MCGSPAKGHRVGPLGISTLHWKRALGICRSGQAGMSFNRGRTGGRRQLAATKHEGKCGSTTDLTSTRRTRTRATSQPLLRKRNLYTHLEQTSKRVQTLKHVAYYHVRANKLQQSGKHSAKPSSLALNSFSTHTHPKEGDFQLFPCTCLYFLLVFEPSSLNQENVVAQSWKNANRNAKPKSVLHTKALL